MKFKTPLIAYHCKDQPEPILSIDFSPSTSSDPRVNKFATCGADSTIKIWQIINENNSNNNNQNNNIQNQASSSIDPKSLFSSFSSSISTLSKFGPLVSKNQKNFNVGNASITIEFIATLDARNSQTVNVVRFSPSGDVLASGYDDILFLTLQLAPLLHIFSN